MKRKPICAYCGNEGKSKEHVFPGWLLRDTPEYRLKFNSKKGKVGPDEMTIQDVCEPCNNGPLSRLDTYCLGLYNSYWSKIAYGEGVQFEYDFFELTRWLLKVSFNSARHQNTAMPFFQKLIPYMLGQEASLPDKVLFFMEVVFPSVKTNNVIDPHDHRSGTLQYSKISPFDHIQAVRFIAINSYYFYIVFPFTPIAETVLNDIENHLRESWVQLSPEKPTLSIYPASHYLALKSAEIKKNYDKYAKGVRWHLNNPVKT